LELTRIPLPRLEEFSLAAAERLRPRWLAALSGAALPRLKRLTLSGVATIDDLGWLLEAPFPALEHLSLRRVALSQDLLQALAGSPALRQLQRLDLLEGGLSDREADLVHKKRHRFRHLRRLDLSDNNLSQRGCSLLEDLCHSVRLGDQLAPL
jgi:hypothetical protein